MTDNNIGSNSKDFIKLVDEHYNRRLAKNKEISESIKKLKKRLNEALEKECKNG